VAQYGAYSRKALGFAPQDRCRVGPDRKARLGAIRALPVAEPQAGARGAMREPGRWRSRRAAARRRQVVAAFAAGLAVCLFVGLATGSTVAWWCLVALLPFACGYLALLAWVRRLEAEREINAAFLSGSQVPGPAELFANLSCFKLIDVREQSLGGTGPGLGVPSGADAGRSQALSV
jgi:hypothetical protein